MATVKISVAAGDYEIIRPLTDGAVTAAGLDLVMLTDMNSRERHWRMSRKLEFDVAELNVAAYLMAKDRGIPVTAIPVFAHRRFRHGFAFVNAKSGIEKPADLIGKRIGTTNFQPAGNIWLRGILEEHYGVNHKDVIWMVERPEDVPFTPAPDLKIERIPAGKSLEAMLVAGEIPALLSPDIPKSVIKGDPRVRRLFPNYKEVEQEYFRKTGIFPIMHVTVIREALVEQYAWLPGNLAKAFEAAKRVAYKRNANPRVTPMAWARTLWDEERALLGPDPWEYGLTDQNRRTLSTIQSYIHSQGLITRKTPLEELFIDVDLSGVGAEERI